MNRALFLLLLLAGCKDKEPSTPGSRDDTGDTGEDTGPGTDTDTDDTTDTPEPPCEAAFFGSEPPSGHQAWYYRDPVVVTFDAASEGLATITARDSKGGDVPLDVSWSEDGIKATVTTDASLSGGLWTASEDYTLTVEVCDVTTEIAFAITEYGAPMTIGSGDLIGRTYYIDMSRATYTEPPGVGAVLGLFLTEPLLIGVTGASVASIDLMGSQGKVNESTGEISQDKTYSSFVFGAADFEFAPYFSAQAEVVTFDVGADIPIYGFEFEGTFSADGTRIGGGKVRGLGDTRYMGPLLEQGDEPNAACTLVEAYGLSCEKCPDGNPYCLNVAAEFEDAVWLEGVTLEEVVVK